MYRLLIVEDEDIIRRGIRKIVHNMGLKIGDIAEAASGAEALAYARAHKPDIIVTDIRMENGDGLALLRSLQEEGIRTQAVILSGFGEFAYAQQAISLGVSEYLLKPIKKKNLYDTLVKLIERLDTIQAADAAGGRSREEQSRVIGEAARGRYPETEIETVLSSAGISFPYAYLAAVSLYVGQPAKAGGGIDGIRTSAAELADRLTSQCKDLQLYAIEGAQAGSDCYISLLVNASQPDKGLPAKLLALAQSAQSEQPRPAYGPTLRLGVSDWSERMELLPRLLSQSLAALDFRLLLPQRTVFSTPDLPVEVPSFAEDNLFTQAIRSALKESRPTALQGAVADWFRYASRQPGFTPAAINNTFHHLLVFAEFAVAGEQERSTRVYAELTQLYRSSAALEQFTGQLTQLLVQACKRRQTRPPVDSHAISLIIQFLERHYDQPITLQSAASQLYMNASYFSSLFKKKTGINFNRYLKQLRIEKSKALLLDPQYKIYEVASRSGFTDEKYFFKVFKSVTGITPNEYRDRL
ncbi:response regulator [Paenibacillaceae bacterium]|nr:response regulator [Paenibacillaceae bacterium]